MNFNLKEKVIKFLKENIDKKFTASEIADNIIRKYPNECKEKENNSMQKILIQNPKYQPKFQQKIKNFKRKKTLGLQMKGLKNIIIQKKIIKKKWMNL